MAEQVEHRAAGQQERGTRPSGLGQPQERVIQAEAGRQVLHGERGLGQLGGALRRQAGQHPVDGAQPGRVGGRVDQERQPVVPRSRAQAGRAHLGLQLQVGRVPVVPVGDQRPAAGQVGGDRGLLAGIA